MRPLLAASRVTAWHVLDGVELGETPEACLSPLAPNWRDAAADRPIAGMLAAFAQSGGVASGDEVACLLRHGSSQPISLLARWIVARKVVSFSWRAQTLLPLFQFDFGGVAVKVCVQRVIAELAPVFDDWDMAIWFAQPNSWLAGAAPADLVARDLPAVLEAARADRFIAKG